jgi:hypothetical protein
LNEKEMSFEEIKLSESMRTTEIHDNQSDETAEEIEEEHHDTIDLDIVLLLFLMLLVGGILKEVSGWIGLPYTSLITVLGLILGIVAEVYDEKLGKIGVAIKAYSNIPPHFLLLIFLPALIFESAFNSDWHIFKA